VAKRINLYGSFQPTQVDDSSARRIEALAQLGQTVQKIGLEQSEQIYRRIGQKRAQEGEAAGTRAGLLAAEEGQPIESREAGRTLFEDSYNTAMRAAYLSGTETDIRNNIAAFAAEHPADTSAFQAKSQKYQEGLMENVSPEFGSIVNLTFNQIQGAALAKIRGAEIKKNIENAKQEIDFGIQRAVDDAVRFAAQGDIDASEDALVTETALLNAGVSTGLYTENEAFAVRRKSLVDVNAARALGAMKQMYNQVGAQSAAEFIARIDQQEAFYLDEERTIAFTVDEKRGVVDLMQKELSDMIRLDDLRDGELLASNKEAMNRRRGELLIGILEGDVDRGMLFREFRKGAIDNSGLEFLTNKLETRGQGTDDYWLIMQIQRLATTSPMQARSLVEQNLYSRLTGEAAARLDSIIQSSIENESILQTGRVSRLTELLQDSVAPRNKFGFVNPKDAPLAAQIMFAFSEKVLSGENPAQAAKELMDAHKAAKAVPLYGRTENPKEAQQLLDDAFAVHYESGKFSRGPLGDTESSVEARYNAELEKIDDFVRFQENYQKFQELYGEIIKDER
jgi:hypothetical protein